MSNTASYVLSHFCGTRHERSGVENDFKKSKISFKKYNVHFCGGHHIASGVRN